MHINLFNNKLADLGVYIKDIEADGNCLCNYFNFIIIIIFKTFTIVSAISD